jgi:hypothetical protein
MEQRRQGIMEEQEMIDKMEEQEMIDKDLQGGTFVVFHAGTMTYMDVDDGVYLVEIPPDAEPDEVNEDFILELVEGNAGSFPLNRVVDWRRVFGNE